MSKVLVLYYSTYGHIETMAQAVTEGAHAAGATVDVPRRSEAPGRIGKRRNWASLDGRVWPELTPLANSEGFVLLSIRD